MKKLSRKTISLIFAFTFTLLMVLFMPIIVQAESDYTITFDINGGTESIKYPLEVLTVNPGTNFTLPSHPELPEITLVENGIYITVNAPEGKVFDAYEVDGVRKNPEDEIEINKDTVIKYLWKDIIYIHKIEATIEAPTVGNIVDAEYNEFYEHYDYTTQTNRPIVTVPDDANYYAYYESTYWYTDNYDVFRGKIEKDTTYNAIIYFTGIDEQYQFADDVKVIINGKEITDFSNMEFWIDASYSIDSIEELPTIYEYVIDSQRENSEDSISFTALEGDIYSFDIYDILGVTDDELQEVVDMFNDPEITFEALKEQLNKLINYAKKAANGKGTLLKLYEMYLHNNGVEITEADGGFKIKLKIADDIKGYDSYSLIYIAEDGTTEEAIKLTKNGEYLEGILPHLSIYALVGNKSETIPEPENNTTVDTNTATQETATISTNNPKTGDNIATWISLMIVSIFGIAVTIGYTSKNK